MFVHLPDVIEELWFKPVIWITPLFWWSLTFKGKDRLTMFEKNGIISLLLGTIVGVIYFGILKKLDFVNISFTSNLIGVALATAVTEELVFSGFIAGYLDKVSKNGNLNLLIVGLMVALMRMPILLLIYKVNFIQGLGVLLFAAASGAINAWIRTRTGNVAGSIVARMGINLAVLI